MGMTWVPWGFGERLTSGGTELHTPAFYPHPLDLSVRRVLAPPSESPPYTPAGSVRRSDLPKATRLGRVLCLHRRLPPIVLQVCDVC